MAKSLVKVGGIGQFTAAAMAEARRLGGAPRVEVAYDAPYAVYVHENLSARHPVGAAKFLERPMREGSRDLAALIESRIAAGATLTQALQAAGDELLRRSQALVPVDTGRLKNSGRVRVNNG